MKALILLLSLPVAAFSQQLGDSHEKIEALLGKPTTAISRNGQDIKIYKNGAKVHFEKGQAVKIDGVKNRVVDKNSTDATTKNHSTRLSGQWRSDFEKTSAYFKYLGRGKTSQQVDDILKKYVGKIEMSFSQDKMAMKTEAATKEFSYEVIGEYSSMVKLRIFHKEETIDFTRDFHFESEAVFWTPDPENPVVREYFVKK